MIFFWYGDNSYAVARAVKALKQKYVDKVGDSLEYERIDAKDYGVSKLLDQVATIPMFVTSRLIVVDNLIAAKPSDDQLKSLLSLADASTVLVVVESSPDKRSRVYKQLSKQERAKEFKPLSPGELSNWVLQEFKRAGVEADRAIANKLVDWAGTNQWQLYQEIQKLALYDQPITAQTIEQVVAPTVEASGFALIDALFEPELAKSLQRYQALSQDTSQSDQQLIGLINWQLRVLALAREGMDKGSDDWMRANRIAPFVANKAKARARNIDAEAIQQAYNALFNTDLSIKTGKLSADEAVQTCLVQLHGIFSR